MGNSSGDEIGNSLKADVVHGFLRALAALKEVG